MMMMMMIQCVLKHVAIQIDIFMNWGCVCLMRYFFSFFMNIIQKGMHKNGIDSSLHR
jgi:hypothetical protein